ncbi:MAG: phytanoyl-CoA dioxygenase family protein [Actinomycetota bacterium]
MVLPATDPDEPVAGAPASSLTAAQLADYHRDGFVVLKGAIGEADVSRYEAGFARNPPRDDRLAEGSPQWPEPGRFTLARNCLKDPDLAPLAEHPSIIPAVTDVLGAEPLLTAFVIYDRTPGGPGIPSHNDYKRWRPVGSSMNWAFTIVPFCDFDAETGRLFVAPGSHQPERVHEGSERPLEVTPPAKPDEASYVDAGLERGDLLLMNMHLWHRADGNRSDRHRVGAFNKYAAADAPPATGYLLYDQDVHEALSPAGRRLLAVHSDKPLATTRLVLMRDRGEPEFLFADGDSDDDSGHGERPGRLSLPGGPTWTEEAIPDWDDGNYIAALQGWLRDRLRIETPWVSYVGDFDEGDHLCRVYAYTLPGFGFPRPWDGYRWLRRDQVASSMDDLVFGWELDAIDRWLDPAVIRGKGVTQTQARVNQYAY